MDKDGRLVKDRECIYCSKFYNCKGKPKGIACVMYEPRKESKEK